MHAIFDVLFLIVSNKKKWDKFETLLLHNNNLKKLVCVWFMLVKKVQLFGNIASKKLKYFSYKF